MAMNYDEGWDWGPVSYYLFLACAVAFVLLATPIMALERLLARRRSRGRLHPM